MEAVHVCLCAHCVLSHVTLDLVASLVSKHHHIDTHTHTHTHTNTQILVSWCVYIIYYVFPISARPCCCCCSSTESLSSSHSRFSHSIRHNWAQVSGSDGVRSSRIHPTLHQLHPYRDATIIDFVDMIIVWGIIPVLRLLCIYLFHNITHV